ncbi:MAG: hypothetical protein KF894_28980 [Labilithrix sp.]|nr:hypothetical protein [Labilithrix sp.]
MDVPLVPRVPLAPPGRRRRALGLAALALASSGAFLVGCRKDAATASVDASSAAGASDAGGRAPGAPTDGRDELDDDSIDDAPAALRELRRGAGGRDASDVDPACEGAELGLLAAAVDPRCAISEQEWSALSRSFDGPGPGGGAPADARAALRQEARREGNRIVVSVVNGGVAPAIVPLRYHPGRPDLAFSVLAESDGGAVFELAPPRGDASPATARDARRERRAALLGFDGGAAVERVYVASIRLAPGGAAHARLTIDPRIVKRLDRRCGDAGAGAPSAADPRDGERRDGSAPGGCLPQRLASGHVVLYVGQLVASVDVGAPARVEWEVP